MMKRILRRIVCAGALLALSVATSPGMNPASAASIATPATAANVSGEGWGSAISCGACVFAAAVVVAGGPGSILVAVNTPGSAVAAALCAAACYEVFK